MREEEEEEEEEEERRERERERERGRASTISHEQCGYVREASSSAAEGMAASVEGTCLVTILARRRCWMMVFNFPFIAS
jgi:hypothetical protein